MNNIVKIIGNAILVTIIPVIVTAFFSYITMNNGSIGFGNEVIIGNSTYDIIVIENYSDKRLDNLKINIEKDINISNIITSFPLNIAINNKIIYNNKINQIVVNEIPYGLITQIFIPKSTSDSYIEFVNHKELKLEISTPKFARNPIKEALFMIILMIVVYSIVFLGFNYLENKRIERLKEEITNYKEKIEEMARRITEQQNILIAENDKTSKQANKIKKEFTKSKLIFLARLTDCTKELTFWRDTIRKIMYDANKKNVDSEMIIDTVTKSLKTYSTKNEKDIDFATLMLLEKLNKQ